LLNRGDSAVSRRILIIDDEADIRGMDGPTTFRELRNNPATARIPVLLLTAKVQSTDQKRFADLGVEAVLFKPFDPLTLSEQIAAALGWGEGPEPNPGNP
jgi:CheY-like chemotaxis protein